MITDKSKQTYREEDELEKQDQSDGALPPDPETLHKTDPQENMKGPISSLVHKVEKTVEEVGKEKADTTPGKK